MLGALRNAIPRGNGASRNFGFWIAWKESDDEEIVIALDDDCRLYHWDFATKAEEALSTRPRKSARGSGRHFNVLDCYDEVQPHLYPRGFPYSARVTYDPWAIGPEESANVVFNLGLWCGVFDINGIDKLHGPRYTYEQAYLKESSLLVPSGAYISACSMNMHFRRELIPAMYQMLMPVKVMPHWTVDRYGDIWGGFVMKMLVDRAGDRVAIGEPMIEHVKEGDFTRNIRQEHIAHLINDEFIGYIDSAREQIEVTDYLSMMEQLHEHLLKGYQCASSLMARFLDAQLPALRSWIAALK
jgi:hypothetical protein